MSLVRRLMNRNMSLYDQLDVLAECGIAPREGVGVPELLRRQRERAYETSPFKLLLSELGLDAEEPPHLPLSTNVWHMRADCASRGGDYVKVAQRMAMLAGDSLPLEDVRDEFDLRRSVAWLSFTVHGTSYRWPAKIEERWIDGTILSRLAALLDAQDSDRRYLCLDLGGLDCLLGCANEEQFAALRRHTGLALEWLG